jgi:hypothetical protein
LIKKRVPALDAASTMPPIAPANTARNITGRLDAVWTSAT